MALPKIFNKLNPLSSNRTKLISIDASLGNVMIAGTSEQGKNVVMKNYAVDALNNGEAVILFRDTAARFDAYPHITLSPSQIHEMNCIENTTTGQIDIFAGMNDRDANAYVIKIFDAYNEIAKSSRMSYQNYISIMRNLLRYAGKKFELCELSKYSIDDLDDMNNRYCTNQMERNNNDRFLSSFRANVFDLESYFMDFSQNAVGYVFSGKQSLETILKTKPILTVELDFSTRLEESKIVITGIVDAISRCRLAATGRTGLRVMLDGVPNEVMETTGISNLLKASSTACHVIYSVQDISKLVEKSNAWVDYTDSYFFFRQTSNENKEQCSQMFGTYEKEKVTYNNSTTKASFWDRMTGQGGVPTKTSGSTVTTEKERVYPPETFANLPDNQAIYYSKPRNEHIPLTVY